MIRITRTRAAALAVAGLLAPATPALAYPDVPDDPPTDDPCEVFDCDVANDEIVLGTPNFTG